MSTFQSLNFSNKKALVRVDFNVPLDKSFKITDDTRIKAALPTINHILGQGGAVILFSHLGRPEAKLKPDGSIDKEKFTLRHLVAHLSEALGRPVQFCDELRGEKLKSMAAALKPGEVLLMENTRFEAGEEKNDAALAKQLAELGDGVRAVGDALHVGRRARHQRGELRSLGIDHAVAGEDGEALRR